ncbi:MAG: pilus assembly protein [Smithellaceae bacterium]
MKKTIKTTGLILLILLAVSIFAENVSATSPVTDESALFTNSTSPDALILLDLSGSMAWNPAGGSNIWGNSSCTGTFYSSSGTGHNVDCSRLAIAKRSIFAILDDTGNGTIDSQDEGSLGIRMGYMRFYGCADNSEEQTGTYSYTSGCNQIPGSSSSSRRYIGSKYSQIYCNSNTSCTISDTGSYSVGGASANGGTPIATALREAKTYLDDHKAADSAAACRKKFVILITDGSDTYACSGNGQECQEHQYKRRRDVVARAKALADAGYKVFVIGFGSAMPDYLENTLNWMAYYGGTDNPNQVNSGSVTGFTPGTAGACTVEASPETATCYDGSSSPPSTANFKANTDDPGYASLSGYAFLAANADEVSTALQTAINIIRQANYSFSQSSIQSARTEDENFLYEGSFEPIDGDPFWKGHLKKYQINTDGTVGSLLLDAGPILQVTDASSRTIKTYKSGALTSFTTTNIKDADVGVGTSTTTCGTSCTSVVGYIRGEAAYNVDDWKLGDVFRSTPITVGTPSAFFEDGRDGNNQFAAHRSSHVRTSASGNRLIVAGANDGQFHTFKTSDLTEAWSFVPPNLLTKLKNISHATHNATAPVTSLSHNYFVDGPVTVADVWVGDGDGTSKTADWKTMLIFAEGRGAVNYAWSSSSSCDSGINSLYTTTYKYYCGYHAFNLNDSLNPAYAWHIDFADDTARAAKAPYLGDPWSKMMVGRVRIKVSGVEKEKWVGFIGAGYNAADCSGGGTCDTRGKGFFVIDLASGQVLWSYTKADNSNMKYSLAASSAIVDTDNDGFIDTAYIGDLGGNMWRFKFCLSTDTSCGTANWSGGMFFDSSSGNIRPIYTMPGVTKDGSGNLWVFWGTGDKTDPTASNAQEHFYGVKDNDRTSTYAVSNIDNITTAAGTYDPTSSRVGYRILLTGSGQKILADPTIFGGVVYFTSYTPPSGNNPCEQGGTASLNALKYTTGGGALPGDARSMTIGTGIPTAPIISLPPGSGSPDLYVTTSGGGGTAASTQRANITPAGAANRTNMLYWKDTRIQ